MLGDLFDFLADVVDYGISAVDYAFERVKEWASNLLNWLHNFFSKIWPKVIDWYHEIIDWAKKQLEKFTNLFIIDSQRSPAGSLLKEEALKIIDGSHHMTREEFKNALIGKAQSQLCSTFSALGTDEQFNIKEAYAFSAKEVQDDRSMQKLMEEHDYILRIHQ